MFTQSRTSTNLFSLLSRGPILQPINFYLKGVQFYGAEQQG
jgi:hypothetical protein